MKKGRKKKPRFMLRVHILNYNKKKCTEFLTLFDGVVHKKGNEKISIEFANAEQYWKYPEETVLFVGIYSKEKISLKDFIKLIDVTWHYTSGPCHDVDDPEKRTFIHEDAIWSKNTDPDEIFLHKNVVWAHIYIRDPF